MKRPDLDMIRKIKKHGSLSEKQIKELLDLPYFYMSHKLMDDFDFSTEDDLPERTILEEREINAHLSDSLLLALSLFMTS